VSVGWVVLLVVLAVAAVLVDWGRVIGRDTWDRRPRP
jgi:hypothetical protein